MKKLGVFLAFALLFGISLFAGDASCPFCNEDILARQFVHETDLTVTLYTHTPAAKGHLLVIPKRHLERFQELTEEELLDVRREMNLFSKVFTELYRVPDFVILQKNGKNASRSVAHLHFHMIPAPKPFDEIALTVFSFQEKISGEEMSIRTQELRDFLLTMR